MADFDDVDQDLAFGPCCCCGREHPEVRVRTALMIPKKSPIPGHGWGCLECGLPSDGAIAVVCDECVSANAPLRWACQGYPVEGRYPIAQLRGVHEHDRSKHNELVHA